MSDYKVNNPCRRYREELIGVVRMGDDGRPKIVVNVGYSVRFEKLPKLVVREEGDVLENMVEGEK